MAVIYTFPTKGTPVLADLVLISDSQDGQATKNATISSIKDTIDVVDSITAGSGISVSNPTGNIAIGNTGVLSLIAGSNISLSGSTGTITIGATVPPGLEYSGTWDANTNNPTLASGVGTTGEFYVVAVSGSTNLDGITDWKVGDWAIFVESGATDTWQKVDNTSVLNGSGTGQKVSLWSGSGTSVTLTDSIMSQQVEEFPFTSDYIDYNGGISTKQLELNKGLIDGAGSQGVDGYVLSSTTVGGDKEVAWIASPSSYVLPLAANGTRGGVQIGFTENGKNYPVELASEKMYVNVPWTDTTYTAGTGLTLTGTVFSANTVGTQSNLANNASSVAGRSYPIQTGAASGTVGSDHLIVNIPWTDNNTTYTAGANVSISGTNVISASAPSLNVATSAALGSIKSHLNYGAQVTVNAITSTSSRFYGVVINDDDKAMVNVPWTDNNTTYTAGTGLTLSGTVFNANVDGTQSVAANTSSVTALRTYKVQVDSGDNLVVNVPWTDADTTYTAGTNVSISGTNVISSATPLASTTIIGGFKLLNNVTGTAPSVTTTTTNRNYAIQRDSNGIAMVNVPWTDTSYDLPIATSAALGGIKTHGSYGSQVTIESITTTSSRNYGITMNADDKAFVNVPWTDTNTTYTTATSGTLGLVKIGYIQTATRDYPVTLNSEKMLVTVPWTDTVTPVVTASQGLTKTSNNITLDIADPTTGWAILGGGAGATTPIIGGYAGANTTGTKNYGISGFIQSSTVTSANNNVAIGFDSMGPSVTTASNNVVIGATAGASMTIANNNILIGSSTGNNITDGQENSVIGDSAGQAITTGDKNTIIGSGANVNSGSDSIGVTVVGREASATTKSVAVGADANVSGANGTAVGNAAGTASNAPNGIALGHGAQATLKGTVGNVAIGSAINPVSLDQPEDFSATFNYLNVTINGVQYYIRLYIAG